MLSSVSYVCLGMCTGMCVIGRGINLGGQVLPFILFVLFQRSCYFDVLLCVCSFCFYFAAVFNSTMWSDLRAAVPQRSGVLHYLASSHPDVVLASRAPSTSSRYFSSYNRWKS